MNRKDKFKRIETFLANLIVAIAYRPTKVEANECLKLLWELQDENHK